VEGSGLSLESLFIAFKTIFPIFAFIAVGYTLRRLGKIDDNVVHNMNKPLYYFFIPILVFKSIFQIDLSHSAPRLLLYITVYMIICSAAALLIVPRFEKDNRKRGVTVQTFIRSNFLMFAIPMSTALYGDENLGNTVLALVVCTPYFNAFGVWSLEYFSDRRPNGKRILTDILTTPVVVFAILGFAMLYMNIRLPVLVMDIIGDLADVATPLALVMLGGTFTFSGLKKNSRAIIATCSARLIVIPLIVITAAIILGFRQQDLITLLALTGGPVSSSVYNMSLHLGGDDIYAGQLVVVSSTVSMLTLFLGVYTLQILGLL